MSLATVGRNDESENGKRLSCDLCFDKHLKCDNVTPVCGQCAARCESRLMSLDLPQYVWICFWIRFLIEIFPPRSLQLQ